MTSSSIIILIRFGFTLDTVAKNYYRSRHRELVIDLHACTLGILVEKNKNMLRTN